MKSKKKNKKFIYYGLKINANKTKLMVINRGVSDQFEINIDKNRIEMVNQLRYLGTLVNSK